MSEMLKIFSVKNMQHPFWYIMAEKCNLAKILGQTVCISQKCIIIFIKENLLKVPPCVAIINVKWMKEFFFKPCVHTLNEYILYIVICWSWNYKTTIDSAAVVHFSGKLKKNCFGSSSQ